MSDEQNKPEVETNGDVDPILQNDQSGTSTAMPLLPADEYRLEVVSVEQVRNKADTGNMVVIKLKTLDDCTSVHGESVRAGWPLFHRISLTPTEDYPKSSINRNLKLFMVGCGENGNGAFFPLDRFIGKVVKAKVKVQKATAEYDESNTISRFLA